MAIVTITTYSATEVKLTIDGLDFIYKKAYCYTSVGGDYIYFYAHQAELNALRQQYTLLYTDFADYKALTASQIKAEIDKILSRYGEIDLAYLAYYDESKQENNDLVNFMLFRSKDFEKYITIKDGNVISFSKSGKYNIQFSAQFEKDDSGKDEVEIWLVKNNSNVRFSSTIVTLDGNNAKHVASWNWLINANKNDEYKIAWYSADNKMFIAYRGDETNPERPEIPSVILTVIQVEGGNT